MPGILATYYWLMGFERDPFNMYTYDRNRDLFWNTNTLYDFVMAFDKLALK